MRADLDRIRVEPPVDQIEVMRRLVDPERSALLAQPVPAAEVVGAVAGVEIPGEVDRRDAADLARHDQFLDLLVLGRVAVVERHDDRLAGGSLGVEHRLRTASRRSIIGFSVMTLTPRLSALTMQSPWKASTVVTIRCVGFALSSISSRLVNVGQFTPMRFFATSTRSGLMSQRPTNSTASLKPLGDRASPHADAADAGPDHRVALLGLGAHLRAGKVRGRDHRANGGGAGRRNELSPRDPVRGHVSVTPPFGLVVSDRRDGLRVTEAARRAVVIPLWALG